MITLEGDFLDGETSGKLRARLSVPGVPGEPLGNSTAQLIGDGLERHLALADIVVNARVGSMPRRVSWGDGASFTTQDNDAADALQHRLTGSRSGLLAHRLERNLPLALAALVVVSVALVGLMFWGVPYAARSLADKIPEPVARSAAKQTLAALDGVYLEDSLLSESRQQDLRNYLRSYDSFAQRIEFRSGGADIGANALALPAGYVVITDELVELAVNDEELLAVYLHEIGHARGRHAETSVLQSSAWVVLLTFLTGDISGVSETIYSLPVVIGQLAFSREFEREADDFAIAQLQRHNIPVERFATILGRLEQSALAADQDPVEGTEDNSVNKPPTGDSEGRFLEYLSTHPATQERIDRVRAAAGGNN